MDTVCSGTSCLKETRKAAWRATPPEMVVVLPRGLEMGGVRG
jgi:hypothetical protein